MEFVLEFMTSWIDEQDVNRVTVLISTLIAAH